MIEVALNWIDIVVAIIIGLSIFFSVRKGFIRCLLEIVGLGVATFLAYQWFSTLGEFLVPIFKFEAKFIYALAYGIIWGVTFIAINVFGYFLQKVVTKSFLGPVHVVASVLIGIIKGLVFSVLFIALLLLIANISPNLEARLNSSFGAVHLKPLVNKYLLDVLPNDVPQLLEEF